MEIIPFEKEFPEEAEFLAKLCSNKELREAVQAFESVYPESERIYSCSYAKRLQFFMRNLMINRRKTPITKITKIPRNDPCPCGSGKKFKKCCG